MNTGIAYAKMFLADDRGFHQTAKFQSRQTFNFGNYKHEHKQPFGNIYVCNDDVLDAGCSVRMLVEEKSWIVLLPVIGAIAYKDTQRESLFAAGQVQVLLMNKGDRFEISNPFAEELVNFLQLWIKAGDEVVNETEIPFTYDVNAHINSMISIHDTSSVKVSIGKFEGRGETVYQANNASSPVFLFVLEGAFEAEGRLLHARDGLGLKNFSTIDMEALSNEAIMLAIENPDPQTS
jgi:redox-sensitive bicupin YhaK (pirin superfamily)